MPDAVTWTIPQLTDWVNALISTSLDGEIWVEGEITNLQRSSAGHVYFSLIEPGAVAGAAPHTLAVTLFDWHRQNVNRHLTRSGGGVRMSDGVRVRVRGAVEIYGPRSQLQLKMSGIDPVFTLGNLEAERARLLAELTAEGLIDANGRRSVTAFPTRIALITSLGSAAHADFIQEVSASGLGVHILAIDSRVQGTDAVESIVRALKRAVEERVDVIAVVRGGGARTDLAAFDHASVCRAVAGTKIPVWSGLGHETDRTVFDVVAHSTFKTPTACAAAIVERITGDRQILEDHFEAVIDRAAAALESASNGLDRRTNRIVRSAEHRLRAADGRLASAASRVVRSGDARLIRAGAQLDQFHRTLAATPRLITEEHRRLRSIEGTVRAYDPQVALQRGWSITRDEHGRLARADTAEKGANLVTTLAGGVLHSVVTANVVAPPEGVEPQPADEIR